MNCTKISCSWIGEISTRDIAKEEHPQGLKENLNVAKRGGGVAKGAKIYTHLLKWGELCKKVIKKLKKVFPLN